MDRAARRRLSNGLGLLLFAAAVVTAVADAQPQAATPEDLVQRIYATHRPGIDKGIDLCDRRALTSFFDAALISLLLKDCDCARRSGGICALDWDPIYAAQDFDTAPLRLRLERVPKKGAIAVKATFRNFQDTTLIYDVSETKDGWRVSDIHSPADKWSLKATLSRGRR